MKCPYMNAHSMGNKQEELQATVLLESYDLVAITETWPPNQGEPTDEAFFLQLQEASCSQALVPLGDFNHPDICWKSSTASCRQFGRLLECIEDNFLIQVIDTPTRGDAILDLMVINASEFISDVKIGGSLSFSDHTLVEFTVLRDMGQVRSTVRTLNFRKANFQLFKELVSRTPWETVFRDRGAQQSWQIFKDAFHKAQELLVPRCRKSGKEGKRPAWLSRDVLVKLKRELHRQWKQGQVTWEEYRNTARLCRDGVRKAKAQLELNLAGNAKNNKKGFYRYVNQKRKVKESIQNCIGWKRPLRSLSPTVNLTLPRPPLYHVHKHLIQTSFKYLQGWRLNHFPGQPGPMLDNPLGEEKFPNIQSKPPLAQLEAISSCPITFYLGEETDPHLSTTSFQVVEESNKVSPQPPFLQAKQSQLPQPLLIRLLLQSLHQLHCPSLDTLQHLNVSLVVGGPKLNTVFEVRPHQCRVQGHDHFPSPAGHTIFDTSQDAFGFLGHLGTLIFRQLSANTPRSFSARQLSSHLSSHPSPSL
ncbi:hypothetical protein QYF61_010734 [Mycteria americana]|uniref:Endonuclease/exonuclease/phosphatase domain-containing protein n=1 Tax=Mycteria americana TaxID=33587 RepID=A0AAN7P456_MYCAM|nr:hypothetical protein QYF61_010734 [Mycteria americana]